MATKLVGSPPQRKKPYTVSFEIGPLLAETPEEAARLFWVNVIEFASGRTPVAHVAVYPQGTDPMQLVAINTKTLNMVRAYDKPETP